MAASAIQALALRLIPLAVPCIQPFYHEAFGRATVDAAWASTTGVCRLVGGLLRLLADGAASASGRPGRGASGACGDEHSAAISQPKLATSIMEIAGTGRGGRAARRRDARRGCVERLGGGGSPAKRQDAQLPTPPWSHDDQALRRVLQKPRLQRRPGDGVEHELRRLLASPDRPRLPVRLPGGGKPVPCRAERREVGSRTHR